MSEIGQTATMVIRGRRAKSPDQLAAERPRNSDNNHPEGKIDA